MATSDIGALKRVGWGRWSLPSQRRRLVKAEEDRVREVNALAPAEKPETQADTDKTAVASQSVADESGELDAFDKAVLMQVARGGSAYDTPLTPAVLAEKLRQHEESIGQMQLPVETALPATQRAPSADVRPIGRSLAAAFDKNMNTWTAIMQRLAAEASLSEVTNSPEAAESVMTVKQALEALPLLDLRSGSGKTGTTFAINAALGTRLGKDEVDWLMKHEPSDFVVVFKGSQDLSDFMGQIKSASQGSEALALARDRYLLVLSRHNLLRTPEDTESLPTSDRQ